MDLAALKRVYGDEYPATVLRDGMRCPLQCERRFSRYYHSAEHNTGCEISRFMDGSASITASELQEEWPSWTDDMRSDFCQSCCWLHEQADFPEMLRFVMQHGGPEDWSGIAGNVASRLPREEAFDLLARALRSTEPANSSNVAQGIALTKHPEAEATLRNHLDMLWKQPGIWNDAEFINWLGFAATTCISHLIEVGAPPSDFTERVRSLSEHSCSHNQESCRNFLSKHYPWLERSKQA
jgi:hypothetical protein